MLKVIWQFTKDYYMAVIFALWLGWVSGNIFTMTMAQEEQRLTIENHQLRIERAERLILFLYIKEGFDIRPFLEQSTVESDTLDI